jgi:hypothetical protein
MLIMGFIFVLVVLFLPKGLAGAVEILADKLFKPNEPETRGGEVKSARTAGDAGGVE